MADERNTHSFADKLSGPWMSPEVLAALPQLKRDYAHNASHEYRAQSSDGRQSAMVGNSQPKIDLRPSASLARPVDATAFKSAWMREQRDAAMVQARQQQNHYFHERNVNLDAPPQERRLER